jgi:hypothetical protein
MGLASPQNSRSVILEFLLNKVGPILMICYPTKYKAIIFVSLLACASRLAAMAAEARFDGAVPEVNEAIPAQSGLGDVSGLPPQNDAQPAAAQAPATSQPMLSAQEEIGRQIAERNGEKKFLMVDKARGEILLFENGKLTFSGSALTGASLGDRVPPNVLAIPDSHPLSTEQKVTPAGRFTVRREIDEEYGRVWTITEIHGIDWEFAIHEVYLGIPSEHRDERLRSANPLDHHITFGCIDVEKSTIELFARILPRRGKVPLYILPQDTDATMSFFPSRMVPVSTPSRP